MLEVLVKIMDNLAGWVNNGSRGMMDKTAKGLASKYRQQIREGKDADGSSMAPLAKATLEGPVRRRGGNVNQRKDYGSRPLVASGETLNSIESVKTGFDEWQIFPQTDHGRMVLLSNAKITHSGRPFYGDVSKPVRDPLSVEDVQLDYFEEQIYKDLDRLLNTI